MKNLIVTIFLSIILSGCHWGNSQDYVKKNISAGGFNYLGWGNFRYGALDIGSRETPFYKSSPQFMIKLPDGNSLLSTQFTTEIIGKLPCVKITKTENSEWTPDWLRNSVNYVLNYGHYSNKITIFFTFKDSKLLLFGYRCDSLADKNKINFQIGKIDESKLFKVPLRYWQLKELFEAPDKTSSSWVW